MRALAGSAKGQVTIPVAPQRKPGIEPGADVIAPETVETGLASLCGLAEARHPIDLEAMDEAIADAVLERHAAALLR